MEYLWEGVGKLNNRKKIILKRSLLNVACVTFSVIALALIVLLILSGNDKVQYWWQTYQDYLAAAETKVEDLGNEGYIIFTLMFLFAFKAFIPIYPLSLVCAAAGVVFPVYFAIPVNIIGLSLHYTLKYVWGKRIGPGGVNIILKRNEAIRILMKKDGTGNPLLLVIFRAIPFFPVNPVSQLYGSMGFKYWKFLLLSLLGYSPLLCTYTIVGRNVYNPLSAAFLLPLIIVSVLAAVVAYALKILFYHTKKRGNKNGIRTQSQS